MPTLLDRIAARIGLLHAGRLVSKFRGALADVSGAQQRTLDRLLGVVRGSEQARRFGLERVRTVDDLRRALPVADYEAYRPLVDRVCDGDVAAMFRPGARLRMFATSSGTTALPKRVPVTAEFEADYRRGWNVFGMKVLQDHPDAILRHILQSTSRYDVGRTPSGVPYGAITGLLARTQKRIVRHYYVSTPDTALLDDPQARHYVLMRRAIVRDLGFAVTANPATLINMARLASEHAETLIRDVHDGDLAERFVPDRELRRRLCRGLRPDPDRAAALARLRELHGVLRPRDYWRVSFLACWTGGSMGNYVRRLREWWGELPVRDIGLLASEGRVSVPMEDDTPAGVLDVTSAVFEFIPAEEWGQADARTVLPRDVEVGRRYVVVLSNTTGLLRYRLDDVVAVRGWLGESPLVEFLHRAGRVSSVAGEKLTENQVVAAFRATCGELGCAEMDFLMAPCWGDPPYYRVNTARPLPPGAIERLDENLCTLNEEYDARRKTSRLGPLTARVVEPARMVEMDRRLASARRSTAEQFKRPFLVTEVGGDDAMLDLRGNAEPGGGGADGASGGQP